MPQVRRIYRTANETQIKREDYLTDNLTLPKFLIPLQLQEPKE